MNRVISILFIFYSSTLIGQDNLITTKKINPDFSHINFSQSEIDSFYLNLPILKNVTQNIYIRLSNAHQIIDFYSIGTNTYEGVLTNRIFEFKVKKGKKNNKKIRIHYTKENIDSVVSTKLVNLILQSNQPKIPSDSEINGWKINLDCSEIEFQFKIAQEYSEQIYRCIESQNDSIEYKNIIISNFDLVEEELSLSVRFEEFFGLLPKKNRTYLFDEFHLVTYKK